MSFGSILSIPKNLNRVSLRWLGQKPDFMYIIQNHMKREAGDVNKQNILTIEGLAKLEEELDYLKSKRRAEVAQRIKQALAFGDISENSEYDEAKNE